MMKLQKKNQLYESIQKEITMERMRIKFEIKINKKTTQNFELMEKLKRKFEFT